MGPTPAINLRSAADALDGDQAAGGSPVCGSAAFAALSLTSITDLTVLLPYQRGQSIDTLRGPGGP